MALPRCGLFSLSMAKRILGPWKRVVIEKNRRLRLPQCLMCCASIMRCAKSSALPQTVLQLASWDCFHIGCWHAVQSSAVPLPPTGLFWCTIDWYH